MAILVTGATGYIGSHVSLELIKEGHDVILLDNLSNSKINVVKSLEELTGKSLPFYKIDLLNKFEVENVFKNEKIDGVIYLAAFKAVAESIDNPLKYYSNNIGGLINLCELMKQYNIKNFVFSSSATVYGNFNKSPLTEYMPLSPINPYGNTKLISEQILKDLYISDNNWSISILRYFNPVGADESGKIGEDPTNPPSNIMPIITNVATGKTNMLYIFGDDYDTPDGTCIRDFIHISDLANGHVKAIEKKGYVPGVHIYNLGTGNGYSVLDLVNSYQKVNDCTIPYEITSRRQGDIDICFADATKAARELGWTTKRDLDMMCKDAWRWGKQNR